MGLSSRICSLLYDLAETRNGHNASLDLNGVPVLVIQRFEDADHILRRNAANYRKNMAWFRQALGASRFSEDGRAWEIRRDLTQVYFSKFDRQRTFELSLLYAGSAIEKLISNSDKGSLTIDDDILREMTASVLVENFFEVKLDETGVDLTVLAELMELGSEYSFVPAGKTGSIYQNQLSSLPTLRRRVLETMQFFRSENMPTSPIFRSMMQADRDTSNNIVLEHELMTFLAAGAETSAATMGWACYLLAKNQSLQDQLRHQTYSFWSRNRRSWSELREISTLRNFISETLRLFPPTPIISRLAIAADRIGDQGIQKDQNVMISFIGIQNDRRHRSNPWVPDIGDVANRTASGEQTSFSFGPRVCGGKQFAMVELVTFLSLFLKRARFELTSDEPPTFRWKSQMLREGGQPVRVVALSEGRA